MQGQFLLMKLPKNLHSVKVIELKVCTFVFIKMYVCMR